MSGAEPDTTDLQSAISEVSIGIARVYTMAAERVLHAQVFGRAEETAIEIDGPSSDKTCSALPSSDGPPASWVVALLEQEPPPEQSR